MGVPVPLLKATDTQATEPIISAGQVSAVLWECLRVFDSRKPNTHVISSLVALALNFRYRMIYSENSRAPQSRFYFDSKK